MKDINRDYKIFDSQIFKFEEIRSINVTNLETIFRKLPNNDDIKTPRQNSPSTRNAADSNKSRMQTPSPSIYPQTSFNFVQRSDPTTLFPFFQIHKTSLSCQQGLINIYSVSFETGWVLRRVSLFVRPIFHSERMIQHSRNDVLPVI